MGLDMYLRASQYVSGYEFTKESERSKYQNLIEAFGAEELADKGTPSATVNVTVAYWRKANQIHKWFVDNVQDGKDDCGTYYVPREKLEELRDTCKQVLSSMELAPGKVSAGQVLKDGEWETIWEDGGVVTAPGLAEALLPNQSGFFFGGTDYDEWYVRQLQDTVEQIDRVLKVTEVPEGEYSGWDFEYHSSW